MPLIILTVLAQIACAIHVVQSGRDKYWIALIVMAPGLGCAVYFFTQVLPDMGSSRTAGRIKQGAIKALDPQKELREAHHAFDMVESVDNRLRLADALIALEKWDEAEPYVIASLAGTHEHDPHILIRMALIRLEQAHPQEAVDLLDRLQKHNPGFHSERGHLLYCRAMAAAGHTEAALSDFEQLIGYATGEEARVRYGLLLKETGNALAAQQIFEEVEARVKRGTRHYKKSQADWLATARKAKSEL